MSDYNQQAGAYPNQPHMQPQQGGEAQWPHMKLKDWVITFLLMLIPGVNIILPFVWAFGRNVNPSKKSYFQIVLIMMVIGVVFGITLGSAIFTMISGMFRF